MPHKSFSITVIPGAYAGAIAIIKSPNLLVSVNGVANTVLESVNVTLAILRVATSRPCVSGQYRGISMFWCSRPIHWICRQ